MRNLRNYLLALFPSLLIFVPSSNFEKTHDSIADMALRLATELNSYIISHVDELSDEHRVGRLSFIGFSMGGLIIRKALEYEPLRAFHQKLYLYISLASPHLGSMYADSQLVGESSSHLLLYSLSPSHISIISIPFLTYALIFPILDSNGYVGHHKMAQM